MKSACCFRVWASVPRTQSQALAPSQQRVPARHNPYLNEHNSSRLREAWAEKSAAVALGRWTAVAACTAAGLLIWCQPVQAVPMQQQQQQLVLLQGNAAIMSDLKRLSKTQQMFGSDEPTGVLSARFLAAQQQLLRIELLVKIQQYDQARLQLREGAFKSLRMDLAFGQEMYRIVKPEATRAIIEGIEQLDKQLKGKATFDEIRATTGSMSTQLTSLSELLSSIAQ